MSNRLGQSFSNPNSTIDLSATSPTQGKPIYMPEANRRQRRASLVSTAIYYDTKYCLNYKMSSDLRDSYVHI